MSKMKPALLGLVGVVSVAFLAQGAEAASPNGVWKSNTGRHIQVFSCGGGLGMKIVRSSKPAHVGKVIMCGAKKVGPNKWKGTLLNVSDGKKYTGYATLKSAKALRVEGCVLGGLICQGHTWPRIK